MSDAVICDLDSTLCDTSHRDHLANLREWDAFYKGCGGDKPNPWCVKILEGILATHSDLLIFFITGRPEWTKPHTSAWLKTHLRSELLVNSELHHRPDKGWGGKTLEFKKQVYETHIKNKHNVLFALEDDVKLIRMWRAQGLHCLAIAENDY